MLPNFLLTSTIYHCLVWRKPHQYKPDQSGVSNHVNLKTLVQTWMGDINGDDSGSNTNTLDVKICPQSCLLFVFGQTVKAIAVHFIHERNAGVGWRSYP